MYSAAKLIAAGLATLSLSGVAIGIGVIFSGLLLSTSRNPSLRKELFNLSLFAFALTEAMGLFALMMAFLFLFAF
jgi:F-type H+-transporting ATPase subunit c